MFGLSAATLAAIGSTAIAAGTTTASFIQAGKQKKAQRKAEREASKKMASARRSLEKNYMESLSIPLEAYEREMEAINVGTAQATQAAVEGSQRGVAATAGQVRWLQRHRPSSAPRWLKTCSTLRLPRLRKQAA